MFVEGGTKSSATAPRANIVCPLMGSNLRVAVEWKDFGYRLNAALFPQERSILRIASACIPAQGVTSNKAGLKSYGKYV
jgi:hypothetical protein